MDNGTEQLNEEDLIFGVDIGGSRVKIIIGSQQSEGKLNVVGLGYSDLNLKLGSKSDLQTLVAALKQAVTQAEQMCGFDVRNVYVGVSGVNLRVISCVGQTTVTTGEVTQDDIKNAIRNATLPASSGGNEEVHSFCEHFTLDDDQTRYKNPINMSCSRLTAVVNLVTAPKTELDNIRKCVEQAGLVLEDFVLEPYAAGLAVLSEEEKELGVAVLDVGSQSSDLVIFHDDSISHAASLPYGGAKVTEDITSSFPMPISSKQAETMKKKYGTCRMTNLIEDETIPVQGVGGRGEFPCSKKHLAEVMRARFSEIFKLYAEYLEKKNLLKELNAGIVLTGGCASIEGIASLAEEVFKIPVRCGKGENISGIKTVINESSFAVCIGLLRYATHKNEIGNSKTGRQTIVSMKKIGPRLADFFKKIGEIFKKFI